jgi:hypothetical protein
MNALSAVPPVARELAVNAGRHPVITGSYKPGRGWRPLGQGPRVTRRAVTRLARDGVTEVSLAGGGLHADFRVRALLARDHRSPARQARAQVLRVT